MTNIKNTDPIVVSNGVGRQSNPYEFVTHFGIDAESQKAYNDFEQTAIANQFHTNATDGEYLFSEFGEEGYLGLDGEDWRKISRQEYENFNNKEIGLYDFTATRRFRYLNQPKEEQPKGRLIGTFKYDHINQIETYTPASEPQAEERAILDANFNNSAEVIVVNRGNHYSTVKGLGDGQKPFEVMTNRLTPVPEKAEEQPETVKQAAFIHIGSPFIPSDKDVSFIQGSEFGANWKEQQLTATLQQQAKRISDLTYLLDWEKLLVKQKEDRIAELEYKLTKLQVSYASLKLQKDGLVKILNQDKGIF